MVLASGIYLIARLGRRNATYQKLKPDEDPRTDDPSRTVVFILLAALVLAIGFLLLGLGIFSLVSPAQTEGSIAVAMFHSQVQG